MSIAQNIQKIKLPPTVTLVAVSKTKSIEAITEAYQAGQRIFGENKIQEMTDKYQALPKDIEWHMIGHVQSNKVKYMAPYVSLIHGVDSLKLLEEINRQAQKNNRIINCLLQVHIAQEETKFGFSESELWESIESTTFQNLSYIKIIGLMGMASFTNNTSQIKSEFNTLHQLFTQLKTIQKPNVQATELSMGMSGDYPLAIDCGSTMVRIGSLIFGDRN